MTLTAYVKVWTVSLLITWRDGFNLVQLIEGA
jgi:hypothetical protein